MLLRFHGSGLRDANLYQVDHRFSRGNFVTVFHHALKVKFDGFPQEALRLPYGWSSSDAARDSGDIRAVIIRNHYCPVKSRIESAGWGH